MSTQKLEKGSADYRLAGFQIDLLQKIRSGSKNIDDLNWFINLSPLKLSRLRKGIEKTKSLIPLQTSHLRLISSGHDLTVSSCLGGARSSLFHAGNLFSGGMRADFPTWLLQGVQPATGIESVLVYEMYKEDGTFMNIYDSFGVDKGGLAFKSQEQIEKFVCEHPSWFHTRSDKTFFLFTQIVNDKEEFFVADVHLGERGINRKIDFYKLSHDNILQSHIRHRFVVSATAFLT
jgi:hypothetical protein